MLKIIDHKNYKKIITMCSQDKIDFVYNFTLKNFQNLGIIFEIGTFGGAMTQALALGSDYYRPKIITVDKFIWDHDKIKKFPELQFKDGDDFYEYVRSSLDHLNNIKIIKSNFNKISPNHKIELMIVDAPKKMKNVIKFIKIFSKFWIKKTTKLLMEDYNQFLSYELPATLHPIQNKFKMYTDNSNIVIAEVLDNNISESDYELMDIRQWDEYEIKHRWEEIYNYGDNKKYLDKEISIFMHLIDNKFTENALKYSKDKNIKLNNYFHKQKFVDRYIPEINKVS